MASTSTTRPAAAAAAAAAANMCFGYSDSAVNSNVAWPVFDLQNGTPFGISRSWPEQLLNLTVAGKCTQCGKCACDRMRLAQCYFEGGQASGGCGDCLGPKGPCQCHLPPDKRETKVSLCFKNPFTGIQRRADVIAAKRGSSTTAKRESSTTATVDPEITSETIDRLDKLIANSARTNQLLQLLLTSSTIK